MKKLGLGSRIFIIISILLTTWFVVGFYGPSITRDVSLSNDLWGGYEYHKEYILERDVFLIFVTSGMAGDRLALAPEGAFQGTSYGKLFAVPDTIKAYESDPKSAIINRIGSDMYVDGIQGVVRKGTRFQTHRLEKHYGYNMFYGYANGLTPYVKILDGEFAGSIATIEDISIFYEEDGIFKYRPEELLISRSIL